jgi:peptidoglycan/LPS O-acetylase OafA/YrhL
VTTAPVERSGQQWAGTTYARTERPRPPRGVAIAAWILYVYAAINLVVALAGLAAVVMAVIDGDDSSAWVIPFVLVAVAVNGFYVLLATKTRQGRRWAWITTLILLSFYALLGLGVVAIGLTDGDAPPLAGLLLLVPTSLFILLLAGPRSSREYFRRR